MTGHSVESDGPLEVDRGKDSGPLSVWRGWGRLLQARAAWFDRGRGPTEETCQASLQFSDRLTWSTGVIRMPVATG